MTAGSGRGRSEGGSAPPWSSLRSGTGQGIGWGRECICYIKTRRCLAHPQRDCFLLLPRVPSQLPKSPGSWGANSRAPALPEPARSPPLQHLLQKVLLLGRLLGDVLVTHVPQLARRVRLHGLAPPALFAGPGDDAGLLCVGGRGGDRFLAGRPATAGHGHTNVASS